MYICSFVSPCASLTWWAPSASETFFHTKKEPPYKIADNKKDIFTQFSKLKGKEINKIYVQRANHTNKATSNRKNSFTGPSPRLYE